MLKLHGQSLELACGMQACLDLDLKSQIVIDFEHCRMEKVSLEVHRTMRSSDYAP